MIEMNGSVKAVAAFFLKIVLYSCLMVVLYLIMMYDAQHATITGKFGEVCATEVVQEFFLLTLAFVFIYAGQREPELRPATRLISLFFFMSVIRELNNLVHFWFYLVLPLILLFFWFVYRDRKRLFPSLASFFNRPEIPWFVAGFLVTFIFSRLFGRKVFWQAVTDGDFPRWVKNAAEEGTELLGYAIMFIGGVEMFLRLRKKNKQASE